MKKLIVMLAVAALTGCSGVEAELYNLVIEPKDAPDSCYTDGNEPNTTHPSLPSILMQVEVFDGPEGSSYLVVTENGATYPLGNAGNVDIGGVFNGAKPDSKGVTFTSSTVSKTTNAAATQTNTVTETATITFARGGGPFTGSASVSASRKCEGTGCPNNGDISCSISDLVLKGSRIKTDWQRAP